MEFKSPLKPHASNYYRLLLVILLFFFCNTSSAQQIDLLLVKSASTDIYNQIASSVKNNLSTFCKQQPQHFCNRIIFHETEIDKESKWKSSVSSEYDLIVTLGRLAAKSIAAIKSETPVINSMIPKSIYDSLHKQKHSGLTTATYINQPIERIINLAEVILGDDLNFGVLLSPSTLDNFDELNEIFQKLNNKLIIKIARNENSIGPTLAELLEESDVLLTLPDPFLYNRKTIFNILLATYNKKIPVIGYSHSYVKAGALTAVYSSPADIGYNTTDMIFMFLKDGELPPPLYPKYFSVSVNETVARSLHIHIDNEIQIKKTVMERE